MSARADEATHLSGLSRGERASILLRSFLIQSVWNPRGMQNVGFCFAMLPVLRRLEPDGEIGGSVKVEAARSFLERHLRFFNTNPTLSTYVLSATARAEVAGDTKGAVEAKNALAGPLGMAGDSLLWGGARPAAALLAVSAALLGARWAPALLLAVYNVPSLALRLRGVSVGAERGPRGALEVTGPRFRRVVSVVRGVMCFAAGLAAALALGHGGSVTAQGLVVAGAFFVLAVVALRARVPVTAIGLAGVVGGAAMIITRL